MKSSCAVIPKQRRKSTHKNVLIPTTKCHSCQLSHDMCLSLLSTQAHAVNNTVGGCWVEFNTLVLGYARCIPLNLKRSHENPLASVCHATAVFVLHILMLQLWLIKKSSVLQWNCFYSLLFTVKMWVWTLQYHKAVFNVTRVLQGATCMHYSNPHIILPTLTHKEEVVGSFWSEEKCVVVTRPVFVVFGVWTQT